MVAGFRNLRMGILALLVGASLVSAPTPTHAQRPTQGGLPTLAPVVERVTPAVVNIAVTSRVSGQDNPLLRDPFFRHFFGLPNQPPPHQRRSVGSGVIVDARKGFVLTNHHVVENAAEIVITLKDRREMTAEKVGSDPATDIALLRIKPDRLTAVMLGDSDNLKVGDYVLAIGSPFGLGQTVTSGIVSALGRRGLNVEGYEDFIQTDASINPGNSGGPLVNLRGELVGINTAIIGPAGANVGIGFAVPSNIAKAVMEQLETYGEMRRGRLGIAIQDLTPDVARALGLDVVEGAVITGVEVGSSAAQAGLRAGDVIVAVDGRTIHGAGDLRNRIGLTARGKRVRLTLFREKRRIEITVRIGLRDAASSAPGAGKLSPLAGALLRDVGRPQSSAAERPGVLVERVEPGSPAEANGLRAGDLIIAFNRYPVGSLQALEQRLSAHKGAVALTVVRQGRRRLVIIR